jgi:hypothetical protein
MVNGDNANEYFYQVDTNTNNIGDISGPPDSLFHRVQNITAVSNSTYSEGTFRQLNSAQPNLTEITLDGGIVSIEGDAPGIKFYRSDRPGLGESAYIIAGPDGEFQLQNFQTNKNILISTASGSSTDQININATAVMVNGDNANEYFYQVDTNTNNIGDISGGPADSLFDRVKNITTNSNDTYIEGNFYQRNSTLTTTNIQLNEGKAYIRGSEPQINLYRNDAPGLGQSAFIHVVTGGEFQLQNYQADKNILISTASGSSTAEININSNSVKISSSNADINGVDIYGGVVKAVSFTATSDIKLKENITNLDNSLYKICNIRGVNYNWKNDETKTTTAGVIAQEVLEQIPEAVNNHDSEQLSVNYNSIIAHLIESIKELKKENNEYKKGKDEQNVKIEKQQSSIEHLESKMEAYGRLIQQLMDKMN